jgi:hypothetical protein
MVFARGELVDRDIFTDTFMPTTGTNPGSVAAVSRSSRERSASRFDFMSAQLAQAEWTDAVSQTCGRKATLERPGVA